jgi:predicted DNA-binding transcriptional regulator YafY
VLVDASLAHRVERELGPASVTERRPDGSMVVHVMCDNRIAFRSWLLGLGVNAEVLAPSDVRAEIVAWLHSFTLVDSQ